MQNDTSAGPIRVLIAEDESLVAAVTRSELESCGFTVVGIAPDGVKAVDMVTALRPDVVVMDLEMPLTDGVVAAAAIQEIYPTPVVILTSHPDFTNLSKAVATGVGAFIVKPPQAEELERAITIAMARHADLMELRKANQELQQRNAELSRMHERLKTIGDNLPDGYIYQVERPTGQPARFTYISAGALAVHGLSPAAVLSDACVLAAQVLKEDHPAWAAAEEKSYRELSEFSIDLRMHAPNNTVRWLRLNSTPHSRENGTVVWDGIAIDITDRKQAEADQLIRSKLAATGVLAAGLAHDYNNLLQIILLNLSATKDPGCTPAELRAYLDAATEAIFTARDLTKRLITFASGGEPTRQLLDLGPVLREAFQSALCGSNVAGTCEITDGLWQVEADSSQTEHVINHLVLNAREAMPQGGRVILRIENSSAPAGPAGAPPAGDYLHVSLTDFGTGIPDNILPKIFDPYFSTKPRGAQRGMGLGLTICRSIVERHGGIITVDTVVDCGTTVHVYLPAKRGTNPTPVAPQPAAVPDIRSGRILLMDDDASLRTVLRLTLKIMGHEAVAAADGASALAEFRAARERGQPYDVVILDLTVPDGMGGLETLAELRQIDPAVRALVMSGYSDNAALQNWSAAGFCGALAKSFENAKLVQILAQALQPRP